MNYISIPVLSTTGCIITYIISIITYLICIFTWVDTATTIPGYLEKNTLTEEEFKAKNPFILIKGQTIILKYCNTCNH